MRTLDVSSFAQCDQNKLCTGREVSGLCSDCLAGETGPVQQWLDGKPVNPNAAKTENLPLIPRSELEDGGLLGGIDLSDFSPSNLAGKGADAAKSYWWLIILIILAIVLLRRRKIKKA